MFESTDVLVGMHGAGLGNMLYMRPNRFVDVGKRFVIKLRYCVFGYMWMMIQQKCKISSCQSSVTNSDF